MKNHIVAKSIFECKLDEQNTLYAKELSYIELIQQKETPAV